MEVYRRASNIFSTWLLTPLLSLLHRLADTVSSVGRPHSSREVSDQQA